MEKESKALFKVWLGVVIIFALGIVTGAALNNLYLSRSASAPQMASMRDTAEYFETLNREVNLTPAQQTKMRAILDEMRDQYKNVCAEVRPRYFSLREDARLKMRELLTVEQQKRFDLIVTQDDCRCPDTKK